MQSGLSGAARPAVGRYAPSPSGPLHFGSLVAALASYLQARSTQAKWVLRIEDIDPPREVPGAANAILRALEAHGLQWDGEVLYQSQRLEAYAQAIENLKSQGLAFDCGCTRKQAQKGAIGAEGPIYPGTCRNGLPSGRSPRSIRLKVGAAQCEFNDGLRGLVQQNLEHDVGDFVLRRADGFYAYQLAVVIDDAYQAVTQVVRGADLLTSTPRQIYLQQCLGYPVPSYCHVPLVLDEGGEKLSKHSRAKPLDERQPGENLHQALGFLGHKLPVEMRKQQPTEVLQWAVANWSIARIPREGSIT